MANDMAECLCLRRAVQPVKGRLAEIIRAHVPVAEAFHRRRHEGHLATAVSGCM